MTERAPELHTLKIHPSNPLPDVAETPISPEHAFAATVIEKINSEGRKWTWLADMAGLSTNTLRSQIIDDPVRLKLRTARRVASALNIPFWTEGI